MKGYHTIDNKIVIKCTHCFNKLRVPLDKGKILVTCPVCKRNFVYNPDSIFHTLKQIMLSITSWVRKSRRNLITFIITVFILLIVLFFLFSGSFNRSNVNVKPGLTEHDTIQEYYTDRNAPLL